MYMSEYATTVQVQRCEAYNWLFVAHSNQQAIPARRAGPTHEHSQRSLVKRTQTLDEQTFNNVY